MKIGELSKVVGLSAPTLRYYERIGLMPAPDRRGGKRCYDDAALRRARMLKAARQAGLRIAELKLLTQSVNDPTKRSAVLGARLAATDRELSRLADMREILAAAALCECQDVAACAIAKEAERAPIEL
jgi:MerR family redox-sensitive transcriptional activator SoxR